MTTAPSPPEKRLTFRASAAVLAKLRERCLATGKTQSEALRELIEAGGVAPAVLPEGGRTDSTVSPAKPLPPLEEAPRSVFVRLTESEAAAVQIASAGFRSVSAWAGSLIRSRLDPAKLMLGKPEQGALVESNSQLRRVGINLNQIVQRLNQDEHPGLNPADADVLREALAMIKSHTKAVDRLVFVSRGRE